MSERVVPATPAEHYVEADRLLQFAQLCIVNKYTPLNAMSTERAIQLAHIHALLATVNREAA